METLFEFVFAIAALNQNGLTQLNVEETGHIAETMAICAVRMQSLYSFLSDDIQFFLLKIENFPVLLGLACLQKKIQVRKLEIG